MNYELYAIIATYVVASLPVLRSVLHLFTRNKQQLAIDKKARLLIVFIATLAGSYALYVGFVNQNIDLLIFMWLSYTMQRLVIIYSSKAHGIKEKLFEIIQAPVYPVYKFVDDSMRTYIVLKQNLFLIR